MDTLETQKQFGLWWACHSISRLKYLIQRVSDPKCRNNIVVFTNNNTKPLVQMFWHASKHHDKNINQNVEPSLNHQHFHSLPHNGIQCFMRFPSPISSSEATTPFVLRIHGRLRLQEPLDHGIVASLGCLVQRCVASGAAARGQAAGRTQRNEGEKNSGENLGTSKVKVLENVATQKSSLNFRNVVVLRMFWWHRVGWKGHVNHVGSQNALRKL